MACAVLNGRLQSQTNLNGEIQMKKLLAAALLAFAVPAFAHAADEAKPADKSAKKAGKDGKKEEAKPAEGEKKAEEAPKK